MGPVQINARCNERSWKTLRGAAGRSVVHVLNEGPWYRVIGGKEEEGGRYNGGREESVRGEVSV
jgi:hypothetical protein